MKTEIIDSQIELTSQKRFNLSKCFDERINLLQFK
jgi:hypothetical protein